MTKPYHGLITWQKTYAFFREMYKASEAFPRHELFGMTSQVRRAALSAVLNICEGQARDSTKEYVRFLTIARASLAECSCLLECARDMAYLANDDYRNLELLCEEAHRIINATIFTLKEKEK